MFLLLIPFTYMKTSILSPLALLLSTPSHDTRLVYIHVNSLTPKPRPHHARHLISDPLYWCRNVLGNNWTLNTGNNGDNIRVFWLEFKVGGKFIYPMQTNEFNVPVGSRAGLIYVLQISFPSLKIIYIISVIISLRQRHTNTFSINIESSNGLFLFPSTFCVPKSVRRVSASLTWRRRKKSTETEKTRWNFKY